MTNADKAQNLLNIVRNSAALGRGSCSSVDECQSDEELLVEYTEAFKNGETAKQIIEWSATIEQVFWEREGLFTWKEDHADDIAALMELV